MTNQKGSPRSGILNSFQAIILAAGKSSRFNTNLSKLSFTLCGKEMIVYPIELLNSINIPITLVLGHQKEIILNILNKNSLNIPWIEQKEQLGTGHALGSTAQNWTAENILVMNGDMPLINQEIINNLIEVHIASNASVTFITAHNSDPSITGYGRVIKDNTLTEIVESKDFKGDPSTNCCINAGIYLFKRKFLENNLTKLKTNSSGEIYITDLIKLASQNKEKVETISAQFDYVRGINTLKELWVAEQIKRSEIINAWMNNGVHFLSPQSVHIDCDVAIGQNSFIGAGVQLFKGTRIGKNCKVDAFSLISNSTIHNSVVINPHSIISDSEVLDNAQIGPFAHIKNQSIIMHDAKIGNFIEITKTVVGQNSKAKHFGYLGNSKIGAQVNIGAGTVICNYNGIEKNETIIKDNAFIGANSSLIAPLIVEQNAMIAAGSVINQDVPKDSLAISRPPQVIKKNYAVKLKEKYKERKDICENNFKHKIKTNTLSEVA